MANPQKDTTEPQTKKPQTHKAADHAEEPSKPSQSKWGSRGDDSLGGGVDIGGVQPGNSNGANLA
jgi:hypothetical protein